MVELIHTAKDRIRCQEELWWPVSPLIHGNHPTDLPGFLTGIAVPKCKLNIKGESFWHKQNGFDYCETKSLSKTKGKMHHFKKAKGKLKLAAVAQRKSWREATLGCGRHYLGVGTECK
uniref:Uncharacterized protein n=1 Tax=Oryza brachyantha TaxID=4533 RepID=J3MEP8_ORYBR